MFRLDKPISLYMRALVMNSLLSSSAVLVDSINHYTRTTFSATTRCKEICRPSEYFSSSRLNHRPVHQPIADVYLYTTTATQTKPDVATRCASKAKCDMECLHQAFRDTGLNKCDFSRTHCRLLPVVAALVKMQS